jgi:hypothetical protein
VTRSVAPIAAEARGLSFPPYLNISAVLAGQKLGIREVDEGIWLASFMHL